MKSPRKSYIRVFVCVRGVIHKPSYYDYGLCSSTLPAMLYLSM